MKIFVIDTETTGLDPASDRTVEIAAVEVFETLGGAWYVGEGVGCFVNPRRSIPPEASAVHHITDEDVVGAPDMGEALDRVLTPMWQTAVDIVAAHNAPFDKGFLPPLKEKRWIDTHRCALHVWPDAPNHKNQTLRYWLKLGKMAGDPHRALFDAQVTAHILCRLLAERTVDDLLKLSRKCVVLKKVGFGKHFGQLWTEVPPDYLQWASRQDFEPDVKFTVKTEIARRAAGRMVAAQ
jgi:exodeoxyribonuclease X